MEEVLRQAIMIIGSYVAIIVIAYAIINFLSAGFLGIFIKVRASRGKLVLVKVHSMTDQYYKAGSISERALSYKARGQKEKKRIPIPEGTGFYRALMVWCIDLDEETNAIIQPTGESIDTYDAEKYEQLITRALYKPALTNQNDKIVLILLGVLVLGVIILFFYSKNIDGRTVLILEQLKNLNSVAGSSIGVVG